MHLSPIVIFTYNRLNYTKELINSLMANDLASESKVFIFSDGYKNDKDKYAVQSVRDYLVVLEKENPFEFLQVYFSDVNMGLANSVISGVSKIIKQYGTVIVLEDDLILAPGFLKYMNTGLEYYREDKNIWSLSGFSSEIEYLEKYPYDVFFSCRARSWSWATWKDRWESVDWNVSSYNKFKWNLFERKKFNQGGNDMSAMLDRQQAGMINSWAIRWCFSQYIQDKYTVQPTFSLISNSGQDGSGTNCSVVREVNDIKKAKNSWNFIPFEYNANIDRCLAKKKRVPFYKLVGSYIIFVLLGYKNKK